MYFYLLMMCTQIITFFACSTVAHLPSNLITLDTSLGTVKGLRRAVGVSNQYVDIFYNIPFAEPPVGDLRFKQPVPAKPWKGVRDGTTKPNACWQSLDLAFDRFWGVEMWNPNTARNEDCLYLNVYSPKPAKSGKPKSIMVWIFGGGFWAGSSTLDVYDATQLAARNDVIVVSLGYRMGALGFLYLGTEDAPGNAGLLDQTLALQWIKDNAVNLGGSPDSITIFGESAGAVSVGFHMLSPLSRDLFNYAIMESSAPIADWAIQETSNAKERAVKLAESVGCELNSDDFISCLKSANPEVLTDNQWLLTGAYFEMPLGPVVDGYYFPDNPKAMLARGDIKNTSIILGVNKNEGIFFDLYGFTNDFPLDGDGQVNETQFNHILFNILNNDRKLFLKAKTEYLKDPTLSYSDIIDAVSGDILFKCPVVDFAQEYSRLGGSVYMYSFEHRVSDNPWPKWIGVAHGYELEIVFGLPLAPNSNSTEAEKRLSIQMMKMWTNFAKSGNPNAVGVPFWPAFNNKKEKYAIFTESGESVSTNLRHDECAFWSRMGIV